MMTVSQGHLDRRRCRSALRRRWRTLVASALLVAFVSPALAAEIERRDDVTDVTVSTVSTAVLLSEDGLQTVLSNVFAVAAIAPGNELRLSVWEVDDDDLLTKVADTGGAAIAKSADVTALGVNRLATVTRNGSNQLSVSVWTFDGANIVRVAEVASDRRVRQVEIASTGQTTNLNDLDGRFITAARDWDENLHLAVWRFDGAASIALVAEATLGPVASVDLPKNTQSGLHFYPIVSTSENGTVTSRAVFIPEDSNEILFGSRLTEFNAIDRPARDIIVAASSGYSFAGGDFIVVTIPEGPTGVFYPLGQRILLNAGLLRLSRWQHDLGGDEANALINVFDNPLSVEDAVGPETTNGLAYKVSVSEEVVGAEFEGIITAHLGHRTFDRLINPDRGKPTVHLYAWRTDEDLRRFANTSLHGHFTDLSVVVITPNEGDPRFATVLVREDGTMTVASFRLSGG